MAAIYLAHHRRMRARGLRPLTLAQFYDIVFDPIVIPVFIKRN